MYKKGDIVIINFPFSDFKGFKLRPTLIWEDLGNDYIVMPITSNSFSLFGEYSLIKDTRNNLKMNSYLKLFNVNTIDKNLVVGKLGEVSRKDFLLISQSFCKKFCKDTKKD